MLGFPTPYPNELIYSVVARAGVHDGETSPKQLLDLVYNNRKVIATVDLPSHLESIVALYPKSLKLNANKLIDLHTLWPLYASFQPKERSDKLLNWMSGYSRGAAHLASGIVASRVKSKTRFYVCPKCLSNQKDKFGECYLNRLWQVPLIKVCPHHGPLYLTNTKVNGDHRHRYIPVESMELKSLLKVSNSDNLFTEQVNQLMHNQAVTIEFAQWTEFYREFVSTHKFVDGKRIDHAAVYDCIINFWGQKWLAVSGILPTSEETTWLKALLRKHRKSFSFAEHIVAILGISKGTVSISEAIESASTVATKIKLSNQKSIFVPDNRAELTEDQANWKDLVQKEPPKQARSQKPALYARLYRKHRSWLLYINMHYCAEKKVVRNRINWVQRDQQFARVLYRTCCKLSEDLDAPYLSKTFLIHQLQYRSTIEKNLCQLPRCAKLLELYSESTSEYQARRLARACITTIQNHKSIKRWSLLREAGLSDERMTKPVSELLREILIEYA